MSNLELVLNMLAEASTAEISKKQIPKGLAENKGVARKGGYAAKKARLEIEKQTGESVVNPKNAKSLRLKKADVLPKKMKKLDNNKKIL